MTNTKQEALDLVQDALAKAKRESDMDWLDIKDKHNFEHSGEHLRKMSSGFKWLEENGLVDFSQIKLSDYDKPNYKESIELSKDGTQKSDKLLELSELEMKDEEAVLKGHGYDSNEWEIVNAKNSIYNVNAKGGITKTLYSSKITVKKKVDGFNVDKLINLFKQEVKPYKRSNKASNGDNLLELAFTDMHFGINNLEYYKETLDETIDLITSKTWDTIYIPIGSDLLHNDDFKGRTTNDTIIEKVDMEEAWEQAYRFYETILEHCLENAVNVVAKYVCGNHDKTMSYGLVKALSKVFTEVDWDTSSKNKKLFIWNDVAILFLHGDKGTQRISKTIYKEYGKLIADKKVVEIHTGDKHYTKTEDTHGVIFRILPTGAQTDEWHEENSFTGSMKCFHLFEYKKDKLKTIYHV